MWSQFIILMEWHKMYHWKHTQIHHFMIKSTQNGKGGSECRAKSITKDAGI